MVKRGHVVKGVLVNQHDALVVPVPNFGETTTVTQSHSHTVIQSHSHTVTQSHSHTVTQSHSHSIGSQAPITMRQMRSLRRHVMRHMRDKAVYIAASHAGETVKIKSRIPPSDLDPVDVRLEALRGFGGRPDTDD